MKRRYRRYFIILENEDSGFDVASQAPKGHAKIEISNDKGSMYLHCQNLKDLQEKRMRYRWYLVNTKKDEPTIVDIGPMVVDENGKGEIVWEFNGENVQASKESIDDFNLLALLVESSDKKSLEAPLVGYIDKEKVNWRELVESKLYGKRAKSSASINMTLKSTDAPQNMKPIKEEKVADNISLKEEKRPRAVNKPQKEESPFVVNKPEKEESLLVVNKPKEKESPQVAGKSNEVKLEPENKQDVKVKSEISKVEKPMEGEVKQVETASNLNTNETTSSSHDYVDRLYQESEHNILKGLQTYIEGTVKMFPKINPFEEGLENYNWWHMYYNYQTMYRAHMPFIAYIDGMKYPTQFYPYQQPSDYQRQIYQYQHYIFGIVYDDNKNVKYYVYGIPGRNLSIDQPYKGNTGFEYWHSTRKGAIDENTVGYWLIHIDPKTGKVVRPLKATKALDSNL
ncbi:DUF7922 domain-containing protein [Alkaliphilus transvaalensis]|uniref:DUF7922 domain-containing protein n=1 Tax=Alkaliphilus transvaalensis TaxID=114628 RepID=UPI00047AD213|nr:hypothetical protein [Alkaliphilus transvaalensis]